MKNTRAYISVLIICFAIAGCIKEYLPEAITANNNFLVVEGVINATPDSPTVIRLSRTRNLVDTIVTKPELNATVMVSGENGINYMLTARGNGIYSINSIPVNSINRYRLKIRTSDSKEYESELVAVLPTPAIDSIGWTRDEDVTFHVSTHDAANNTRYYRWDFDETWEYNSIYESFIGFRNGQLYFRDSIDFVRTCWKTAGSFDILLGSSVKLTEDVINMAPLTVIEEGSEKLGQRYSILVRQYALERSAYEYWQILQKNSQELGSIFDAQPSQLRGNIRCITNPDEPVIGFVSASTVSEKRLFVNQREIGPWRVDDSGVSCDEIFTAVDSAAYYLSDGKLAPYYYSTTRGLSMVNAPCVDCTLKGGTNKKPSFW